MKIKGVIEDLRFKKKLREKIFFTIFNHKNSEKYI